MSYEQTVALVRPMQRGMDGATAPVLLALAALVCTSPNSCQAMIFIIQSGLSLL